MKTNKNISAPSLVFALLFISLQSLAQGTANFSSNITQGCAPLTVEFFDQSTGVVNYYQWDFGDGNVSGDQNPVHTYNSPGLYTVTLIATFSGIVPPAISDTIVKTNYINATGLNVTETITNATCGNANGVISLSASGGVPPYFVMWSNGDNTLTTDNLSQGSYTVVIEDSSGCRFQETYQVQNSNNNLRISMDSIISESIPGATDGAIDVSVTGGTPPYSYNWVTNGASTQDIANLTAGTYCLLVTDANGCIEDGCFTVGSAGCANFSVTGQVTHIGCNGTPAGSVLVNVSGGTSPYYYVWSNGDDDPLIDNLTAGTYFLTVEDTLGCRLVDSFIVGYAGGFQISGTVTDATPGAADGVIEVSVTGGMPPLQYSWDGGTTYTGSHIHDNLAPGTYCVLVQDSAGCIEDKCFTVGINTANCSNFSVSGQVHASFCSASNGSIDLTVTGGTPPYYYAWSTGSNDEDIFNLTPGVYTVTVEDSSTCRNVVQLTVNDSLTISITGTVTDVSAPLANDGAIDIAVSGGSGYSYIWSTGDMTQDIDSLSTGTYCVTVANSNGCLADACFVVDGGGCTNFTVSGQVTHIGCNGTPAGAINLSVSGGVPPYYYIWSNGSNDDHISNLTAGTYSVTVEDSGSCREVKNFTVGYAGGFQVSGSVTNATGGAANGIIEVSVNGGTAPYQYSWDGGTTYTSWHVHDNLAPGQYCVLVQDANGCIEDKCFTVGVGGCNGLRVTTWNDIYLCGPGSTVLEANAYDGTQPYAYEWSPAAGLSNPLDRITTAQVSTTTEFIFTVTDASGCTAVDTVVVFVGSGGSAFGVTYDTLDICKGDTVRLEAYGGGSYLWDPSATLSDNTNNDPRAFPLTSTTYHVDISDSFCTETYTVRVNVSEDCVWPGDANHDGIADNNDILSLGIAYNISGPVRPNATINWEGQFAPHWQLQFAGGANLKHADCNGDGIVDVADTTAVSQNYGLTHLKQDRNGKISDPALYFEIPDDTVLAGTDVDVAIYLGRDSLPVSNFYGIAFSANYDNTLVEEGTMKFNGSNSWVGTQGQSLLNFSKDLYSASKIDIAQTRINMTNISGSGQIGTLSFTMKDDISGKDQLVKALNLSFSNVKAIDATEIEIDIYQQEAVIYVAQEISSIAPGANLSEFVNIYPNPSTNTIFVDPGNLSIKSLSVINILGQEQFIKTIDTHGGFTLDITSLNQGNYFVRLVTDQGIVVKRIAVQ